MYRPAKVVNSVVRHWQKNHIWQSQTSKGQSTASSVSLKRRRSPCRRAQPRITKLYWHQPKKMCVQKRERKCDFTQDYNIKVRGHQSDLGLIKMESGFFQQSFCSVLLCNSDYELCGLESHFDVSFRPNRAHLDWLSDLLLIATKGKEKQ